MIAYGGKILSEVIMDEFNLNITETSYSSIQNCLFKDNIGGNASAVYIETSDVQFIGTVSGNDNFVNNINEYGPTIYGIASSHIKTERMIFRGNKGF